MTDRLNLREAPEVLCHRVLTTKRNSGKSNVLVGITGAVASGKSRLTSGLCRLARQRGLSVFHIPFDYWIKRDALNSVTYAARFALEDYLTAVEQITREEEWFCPRHDLVMFEANQLRDAGVIEIGEESIWRGQLLRRLEAGHMPDIPGADGLYWNPASRRVFSRFPPIQSTVCVVDGTLVFFDHSVRKLFDVAVCVEASWAERVARMIRRHKRAEVFAGCAASEEEYVSFLVSEATTIADVEIRTQVDSGMIVVDSTAETVSNVLDLLLLKQKLYLEPTLAIEYRIEYGAVELAIETACVHLSGISGIERLSQLRNELDSLRESQHLLETRDVKNVFDRLEKAFEDRDSPVLECGTLKPTRV